MSGRKRNAMAPKRIIRQPIRSGGNIPVKVIQKVIKDIADKRARQALDKPVHGSTAKEAQTASPVPATA
jgi:hypothetical protein